MNFRKCLFMLSSLGFSQLVCAGVVLTEDLRNSGGLTPQQPYSHWVVGGQDSLMTSEAMSGSGSGYDGCSPMSGDCFRSNSLFSVRFSVIDTQNMNLQLTLNAGPYTGWAPETNDLSYMSLSGTGISSVSAVAQASDTTLSADVTYYGTPSLSLAQSFVLTPGDYVFSVGTSSASWSSTSWVFSANFSNAVSEVPLPAALWMFVAGISTLGLRRKR